MKVHSQVSASWLQGDTLKIQLMRFLKPLLDLFAVMIQ